MTRILIPALALLLILTGCATAPKDTLMQVSTIDALLAGAYDGQMTLGELKTHGNLGLGTFDALEGEMIVIDGNVYQARVDGAVYELPDEATTPFAAVVNFDADQAALLHGSLTEEALQSQIDKLAPNKNLFLAFRVDGTFPSMKVRSVPKQSKPYPPLADAVKDQAVFEYTNVTGTVLGFRCPAFVKGINVPDYHLHFISKDRKTGGHVLDLTLQDAALQLDACNQFFLVLTDQENFSMIDLSQDRSHELEKVEK
ncbi:MAG: acetolactate decarboxylase [Kiritimatiellaeota bacterium]|nr:acetolactate decarboxylase [Kiritimatiellota bacterium]